MNLDTKSQIVTSVRPRYYFVFSLQEVQAEIEKEKKARAELERLMNEAKENYENLLKRLREIEIVRDI